MSGEKATKTVIRLLMAWNDRNEERWLREQERAGWRLKTVRSFGYTFERVAPSDVAYRLDVGPSRRHDRSEYLGLFRDAGWDHVGTRGLWQYFRKAVVDGDAPEIHTDPGSRIAMYRRLLAIAGIMLAVLVTQTTTRLASEGVAAAAARLPIILALQVLLIAVFAYSAVRLLLVISRLQRKQGNWE